MPGGNVAPERDAGVPTVTVLYVPWYVTLMDWPADCIADWKVSAPEAK